jgi:hypothetical protein
MNSITTNVLRHDFAKNVSYKPLAKNKGLKYVMREMTPDMSAQILMKDKFEGNLNQKVVKEYADAMLAGTWVYNANPILLDKDGILIDGRKRLMASAKYGVSFRTLIVSGVNRDTVHTLDQHRRRSYSGVLEARGVKHAGSIIRTMAKLIRVERGTFGKPSNPISWARYDQVLELNDALPDAVEMSEKTRGCPLHSTARPVVAYMAITSGHADKAMQLFKLMSDHELLSRGHPAKELALQLTHDRRRGIKPEVDEMIVMGIQALNDMIHGREPDEPYGWNRDFGDCLLGDDGLPRSRTSFMENTPANLGMPVVDGYAGLDMGADILDANSAMIASLRAKSDNVPDKADIKMIMLTPDLAKEWLECFNLSNRKIQKNHVNAIARDIKSGNWMMNAQPIVFSGNPFKGNAMLLNGQHRLQAVIKADMPIEILVATGVAEEAFSTFDTHARHSHGKYVAKGDERVLAAAAKIQWRVDNGHSMFERITPSASEIYKTIDAYPSLQDAFRMSRKKEMQEIGSAGILTYFIARIRRENDQMCDLFLDQLMSGEGLNEGNPVIKARTKLIGKRGDMSRKNVLQFLLDTWDEYCVHAETVGIAELAGIPADKVRYL